MNFITDTNVLLNAISNKKSYSMRSLKKVINTGKLCFSKRTFTEAQEVLSRDKFVITKNFYSEKQKDAFLLFLKKTSYFHSPKEQFLECRDKNDNMFLDLAHETKAKAIITQDKDLLVLKQFQGTEIITPKEFLEVEN